MSLQSVVLTSIGESRDADLYLKASDVRDMVLCRLSKHRNEKSIRWVTDTFSDSVIKVCNYLITKEESISNAKRLEILSNVTKELINSLFSIVGELNEVTKNSDVVPKILTRDYENFTDNYLCDYNDSKELISLAMLKALENLEVLDIDDLMYISSVKSKLVDKFNTYLQTDLDDKIVILGDNIGATVYNDYLPMLDVNATDVGNFIELFSTHVFEFDTVETAINYMVKHAKQWCGSLVNN